MFELREKWRSEFTLLRSQWFDRFSALEQESHKAAQRTLALEQYRQKILAKVQNPHDAKQRLDRMQQRWEAHFHLASSELAGHRQSMRREMHQLEERYRYLHQWAEALANREAILADREKALEIDEVLAQSDASRQDQELQHLRAQCAIYEQQMADLREEVERLACRMLEEGNPADQYLEKAA